LPASLALLTAAGILVTERSLRRVLGTFVSSCSRSPRRVGGHNPLGTVHCGPRGRHDPSGVRADLPGRLGLVVMSCGAGVLAGHAILAGLGDPMRATLVLTAVVALGLAVSTLAPRNALRAGVTIDGRFELAGVAAAVVDVLLPGWRSAWWRHSTGRGSIVAHPARGRAGIAAPWLRRAFVGTTSWPD
jgi:hypothetical protein